MEFLVVTEENAADRLAEEPNEVTEPEPEPEKPAPKAPPEPEPLPPPPAKDPDPIPLPKPPEKKPEKKPAKPPEKKPEKKPGKKVPKPIKIGERVGPVTQGKKNPAKAATTKALSQKEIQALLSKGAKPGNKNQVPPNEASRCYGVIARAFQEACDRYGLETSPTGRDPTLRVSFGPNGTIRAIEIATSSGDRAWDARALQACRQVRSIPGLSATFLAEFPQPEIRLIVR